MDLRRRLRFIWRYLRGNIPWDSGVVPPEITGWIAEYEHQGRAPGRALDAGCGTGTTSIYLAQHGWDVVGLDFAPNAIRRARRKARGRDLRGSVRFESADVSRPDLLAGVPGFDLVVDIGCLHSLKPDQRPDYAANLKRLAHAGATYWLYAFQPSERDRPNRAIGLEQAGVAALFEPEFVILETVLSHDEAAPRPSGWYTLRRTERDA